MAATGAVSGRFRGRRGQRSQGLVEFAFVAPVLLFMIFGTIDIGRLIYTYSALAAATREGARILTLDSQDNTDCAALVEMEQAGKAFPLLADPKSNYNDETGHQNPDQDATGYTQPPLGTAYIYIYPSATADPSNCTTGPIVRSHGNTVWVQAIYSFNPITPGISALAPNGIQIKLIAVDTIE
jgi:TadE-like protein